MPLEFTVGGRTVSAETLQAVAQYSAKPKAKSQAPAAFHKGWTVEGYAPGRIEQAEKDSARALSDWAAMSDARRREALAEGKRAPAAWDRAVWLRRHKPTKVRMAPFSTESAAKELAELAARQGWEHVSVAEMRKGEIAADDPFDTR